MPRGRAYDVDDWFNTFFDNWDCDDMGESIREIARVTGINIHSVRRLCKVMGLIEDNKKGPSRFRDAEPVPECVRYAKCPHCGRRMEIERIPFRRLWDVYCMCGCRVPIPEGYDNKDIEE